jgi:hypothetical protein
VSFWDLSDGTSAISDSKEFSAGGGEFDVIPKGSSVLVSVESADWKKGYNVEEEFVNLKCRVLKPEGYANRVLFFKLWIGDLDPSVKDQAKALTKRDKHRRMIMAIDQNAKGRLSKLTSSPTNEQLALALTAAQFVATLGVWDKDDPEDPDKKIPGGNWLQAAKPKTAEISEGPAVKAKKAPPSFADDLDDDVPW